MGLSGYALQGPSSINYANPASYIAFDTTSFIFDAGFTSNFSTLKTNALSQKSNYTSLNNLLFGFPVASFWRTSFGLLPFSQVGYKIYDAQIKDFSYGHDSIIPVSIRYKYEGSGGINQFYWGNAFKLTPNLSVGVNATFLFGTIERLSAIEFPDSTYMFNSRDKQEIYVHDFLFTYGLQYHKKMQGDVILGAGITYSLATKINATDKLLAESYILGDNDVIYIKDTIRLEEKDSHITLPQTLGVGFSYSLSDIFMASADYQWQNWKKYEYFDINEDLLNSWRAALGFKYCPKKMILPQLFDRIEYRIGAHYAKNYLELRNTQIDEIGVHAGFSLPLRKSKSIINIGFELGRRGTTSHDLIQDNYFKIGIGVSLYERWFVKSKYD